MDARKKNMKIENMWMLFIIAHVLHAAFFLLALFCTVLSAMYVMRMAFAWL